MHTGAHARSQTQAHLLLQTGLVCRRGGRHLVGKAGPQGCGDALVQVGVIEDNGGVFSPQLQRKPFAVWSAFLHDALGRQRASREGDQRHVGVADEGFSCLGARSEHHIHHPMRYP